MKYRRQGKIPALEIEDENGNVICTAEIDGDFFRLRNAIQAKLGKIEKLKSEDVSTDELGEAVLDLMKAVYGEANAAEIVKAFSSNYIEMILCISEHIHMDVMPFLENLAKRSVDDLKRLIK